MYIHRRKRTLKKTNTEKEKEERRRGPSDEVHHELFLSEFDVFLLRQHVAFVNIFFNALIQVQDEKQLRRIYFKMRNLLRPLNLF